MNRQQELSEQTSGIASEISTWKSLTEHAGWQRLLQVVEGQVNARTPTFRQALGDLTAVLAQEFVKGECSGMELFSKIPEIELKRLQEEAEQLKKEIANEASSEQHMVDDAGESSGSPGERRELLDERTTPFGTHGL